MTNSLRAGAIFAAMSFAMVTAAAAAAVDILPAPGGAPVHVRITTTSTLADGPQTAALDFMLRRTGPASAAIDQQGNITPLVLGSNGLLQPDPAAPAPQIPGFTSILGALNIAHAVTGASGAGKGNSWTANVALPQRPAAVDASDSSASPASAPPTVKLALRETSSSAGTDFDGSAQTTVTPPRRGGGNRGGGGGGRGGFGGGGGFGGFGGGGFGRRGGGGGPDTPPAPADPLTLDLRVTGHLAGALVTHLAITQTRRLDLDGLAYTNVGNATIDVVP